MFVCLFVIWSLMNGSSDRKTDYTIKIIRVQGWLLGWLEVDSKQCVLLITKKNSCLSGFYSIPSLVQHIISINSNAHTDDHVVYV